MSEPNPNFFSINTEEKLTLASLASALVSGDADIYAIHSERLWNLQQNRIIATLIAMNISMHGQMISRELVPASSPEEADAFFISCYDHFPPQVTENLDDDSKVAWFVSSHMFRFNHEIADVVYELFSDNITITTTQLLLSAVAHAFALSPDPVAYLQEELDAIQINIPENPEIIQIPVTYTPSYFTENGTVI